MTFSIVIRGNKENARLLYDDLKCQSSQKYEVVNWQNKSVFNLDNCEGNHLIFLREGNSLFSDRVLQELSDNVLDADIISFNLSRNGECVFDTTHLNASDFFNDNFSFQAFAINRTILHNRTLKDETDLSLCIFEALLNNCSYKHVNLYGVECPPDTILGRGWLTGDVMESLSVRYPIIIGDILSAVEHRRLFSAPNYEFTKKLQRSFLYRFILLLRRFMINVGFYRRKAALKEKIFYRKRKREDDSKRIEIDKKINEICDQVLFPHHTSEDVIISLTSYGKRVTEFAPYAIYSLFEQTRKPDRIVLYLDDSWNDDNIPYLLNRLKNVGLEIYYVPDIRSYKKLIPALKMFPDNVIITVDDDMYYDKRLVESLLKEYQKHSKPCVICNNACIPIMRHGHFEKYSSWPNDTKGNPKSLFSAIGVDGILYSTNSLHEDVLDESIFIKYLPSADDIWFWLQAYRNGTPVYFNEEFRKQYSNVPIDRNDAYVEKNSTSLYFHNVIHNANDIQIERILSHYGL